MDTHQRSTIFYACLKLVKLYIVYKINYKVQCVSFNSKSNNWEELAWPLQRRMVMSASQSQYHYQTLRSTGRGNSRFLGFWKSHMIKWDCGRQRLFVVTKKIYNINEGKGQRHLEVLYMTTKAQEQVGRQRLFLFSTNPHLLLHLDLITSTLAASYSFIWTIGLWKIEMHAFNFMCFYYLLLLNWWHNTRIQFPYPTKLLSIN